MVIECLLAQCRGKPTGDQLVMVCLVLDSQPARQVGNLEMMIKCMNHYLQHPVNMILFYGIIYNYLYTISYIMLGYAELLLE